MLGHADAEKARRLFEEAAAQGFAPAMVLVGDALDQRRASAADLEAAAAWYRRAVDQAADVDACERLARMYLKGRGVPKDEGESLRFLAKAASGRHAGSLRALGLRYLAAEGVQPNHARGLAMLVEALDAAHEDKAQAKLAKLAKAEWKAHRQLMDERNASRPKPPRPSRWQAGNQQYEDGYGFEMQSYEARGKKAKALEAQAEACYRQAAELGSMNAQGWMYDRLSMAADVTPARLEEAVRWCRLAADQGYDECMFSMGSHLRDGEGITKDPVEAVYWFDRAAKLGRATGFFHVGEMYERGEGVQQDRARAIAIYWLVREMNAFASPQAGERLQALVEAERLFFEAEIGQANSQVRLAAWYADEAGGNDPALAHAWLEKAAAQGHRGAKRKLAKAGGSTRGV